LESGIYHKLSITTFFLRPETLRREGARDEKEVSFALCRGKNVQNLTRSNFFTSKIDSHFMYATFAIS
jgi:hypothetical protein